MIRAFGPRAIPYAQRLFDLDAIITDPETLAQGYIAAVQRRAAGERFYGMILIDDPRVSYGNRIAEQIVAHTPDYDQRRLIFDQLTGGTLDVGGAPIATRWKGNSVMENAYTEFYGLCDAMLVRSYAEGARLTELFKAVPPRRLPRPMERVLAAANVPAVERVRPERPGVVVWAPRRAALECTLALDGLFEFHGDLTCVSEGGPLPTRTHATFAGPDDASVERALRTATVVVCVDPGDPSDAVGFARLGYGVVAPITSGAHEFAGTIVSWDALDARRLFAAVAVAMGRPARVENEPASPPRTPRGSELPPYVRATELPLVSVVTPTYNRPQELREMLTCLAAQTYPKVEAVVVNDGGCPIDDVVAAFPFARLIEQPRNMGALQAVEVGRTLARGDYITVLPDDDWIYPDHLERLVHAMLRSGASVAHASALLRFLERSDDGTWRTIGFNNRTFAQTITPTEALLASPIGNQQMLLHRSVYDTAGGYVVDFDVSDNEIHARITKRYFYAFVDHVTSEFRDHAGGAGRQCDFPAAMRRMYEEMHPVSDRPILTKMREATIENIASRPAGQPPFPVTFLIRDHAPQ